MCRKSHVRPFGTPEYTYDALNRAWGKPEKESYFGVNYAGIDNFNNYTGYTYDEVLDLYFAQARFYDPQTKGFTQEDPIKDGLNWYSYVANNPVNRIDPWGLEQIVVSGGRYSTDSGFQYEFIETAIKKINEWAGLNDGENITWIIADEGWSDSDKISFQDALNIAEYGDMARFSIVYISNADQLVDYINNKSGSDRSSDIIHKFALFSHGWSGTVALGYNYSTYNEGLNFTETHIGKINASAFGNPNSAFYSCNTGTGGNSSFAQAWGNKVGGRTWAFIGKSDYTYINSGQPWHKKASRFINGFALGGSHNYPVAATSLLTDGTKPYMGVFTSK